MPDQMKTATFTIELRAWVPFKRMDNPVQPQSAFAGDGHTDTEPLDKYRVLETLEFKYKFYEKQGKLSPTPGRIDPDSIKKTVVIKPVQKYYREWGFWGDWKTADYRSGQDQYQVINTERQSFTLQVDASNPAIWGSPNIQAIMTGRIEKEQLLVEVAMTRFPNYGIRIKKDGADIYNGWKKAINNSLDSYKKERTDFKEDYGLGVAGPTEHPRIDWLAKQFVLYQKKKLVTLNWYSGKLVSENENFPQKGEKPKKDFPYVTSGIIAVGSSVQLLDEAYKRGAELVNGSSSSSGSSNTGASNSGNSNTGSKPSGGAEGSLSEYKLDDFAKWFNEAVYGPNFQRFTETTKGVSNWSEQVRVFRSRYPLSQYDVAEYLNRVNADGFKLVFDNVKAVTGQEKLTLQQFVAFFAIIYDETGGHFTPTNEGGGSRENRGRITPKDASFVRHLDYLMDKRGSKRSYDGILGNFFAADQLKERAEELGRIAGKRYDEVLGDIHTYFSWKNGSPPNLNGDGAPRYLLEAAMECDFCKFRGRGLNQITGRENFNKHYAPALNKYFQKQGIDINLPADWDKLNNELFDNLVLGTDNNGNRASAYHDLMRVSFEAHADYYKKRPGFQAAFEGVNNENWKPFAKLVNGSSEYHDKFEQRCKHLLEKMKTSGYAFGGGQRPRPPGENPPSGTTSNSGNSQPMALTNSLRQTTAAADNTRVASNGHHFVTQPASVDRQPPPAPGTRVQGNEEMLSANFSLKELTKTNQKLRNVPGEVEKENLKALAENILERLKAKYGAVTINSAYRSPEVNRAVGGSRTSQHMSGEAADLTVAGASVTELFNWLAFDSGLPYDQIIHEFGRWVHVSFSRSRTRKSILKAYSSGGRTVYEPVSKKL